MTDLVKIVYNNKETLTNKTLRLKDWVLETPETLQTFIGELNSLMDLLEVLKMDVIDMKTYKEKEGRE